jgi:rod shape determining protein RodA
MKRYLPINLSAFRHVDWVTSVIPVIIAVFGIMTIYSATRPLFEMHQPSFYMRQIIWLLIGIVALLLTISFDYTRLMKYAYHIFIAGIVLLVLTLILGKEGMGAQRWLKFGPVSFQPAELCRVGLIIVLAKFLSTNKSPLTISPIAIIVLFFGIVPFILLYKQPDLGTALVFLIILIVMVLMKGIERRILISAIIIIMISLPLVGNVIWDGLKEYQRHRLVAFINPGADPRGIGYQIEQSKITVGAGKLVGKGYLKGTQGPFRFLPEKHTDFIFSVFSEEWGFLGSLMLIALYVILILRGLETSYYAKDEFGTYLSLGISAMFLFYISVNVGMTMGLMPVVGIPLPFFSYGGTALLSNFICIGLLINVRMRRFTLFY